VRWDEKERELQGSHSDRADLDKDRIPKRWGNGGCEGGGSEAQSEEGGREASEPERRRYEGRCGRA